MLMFGIDIAILACFGVALVFASYVVAMLAPLSLEQGETAIITTTITVLLMILAYIIMTQVLDSVLGIMGW